MRASTRGAVTVMDAGAIARSLSRMAHEIAERNHGVESLVLVGILAKGDILARRLGGKLEQLEDVPVPCGSLDVTPHRDDLHLRPSPLPRASLVPEVGGRVVVLVDDVIHHGRTARAALDALIERGRPAAVQLAVLVDRGHRELPIRPDYVGRNIPTSERQRVEVRLEEEDGEDRAVIQDEDEDE